MASYEPASGNTSISGLFSSTYNNPSWVSNRNDISTPNPNQIILGGKDTNTSIINSYLNKISPITVYENGSPIIKYKSDDGKWFPSKQDAIGYMLQRDNYKPYTLPSEQNQVETSTLPSSQPTTQSDQTLTPTTSGDNIPSPTPTEVINANNVPTGSTTNQNVATNPGTVAPNTATAESNTQLPSVVPVGSTPGTTTTQQTNPGYDADGVPVQMAGESNSDFIDRWNVWKLKEDYATTQALEPFQLAGQGLIKDSNGNIRKMSDQEYLDSPYVSDTDKNTYRTNIDVAKQAKINASGEKYAKKDANGNIIRGADGKPIGYDLPAFVTEPLNRQTSNTMGLLSQRLGPRSMLSKGGQNIQSAMLGNQGAVKQSFYTGQENQGLGLLGNYGNFINQQSAINQNSYNAQNPASLIPFYNAASQPYTLGKQLNNDFEQYDMNRNRALTQGMASGIGSVAGMFLSKGRS